MRRRDGRSGRAAVAARAPDAAAPAAAGGRDAAGDLARVAQSLDRLPIGVVICDEDGVEVLRSARVTSLVGVLDLDVLVAEAAAQVLSEARSGPRRQSLELRGPPARSVQIVGAPLPAGGAVAFVEDVSAQTQLDAVRRDFIANVNHELRTPIGALSLLADTLGDEHDPAIVQRLAARIAAEAERAHQLIEDLLDFSRIEANEVEAGEPVSVAAVLDAASARVLALSEQLGVQVLVEPVDQSLAIVGDRSQLETAVTNLLDNAIKYTERGGPAVRLGVQFDAASITVEVADAGVGIPSRDLDRVFERFYRVDRARTRRTGGSGLGLAIVRHVATNHGGAITVTSTEGVGTTMRLRLSRTP